MHHPQALWDQAVRHYQNGQFAEAERLCEQLLRADSRHPMPRHLLGDIRAAQGRFEEARSLLRKAADSMPDNPMVQISLGHALLSLARPGEALRCFDRAIALGPGLCDAWNSRGVALQQLGRLEEAIKSYDGALALAPAHVFARFNRANLLQSQGRHGEALADYDRALAQAPRHAGARNNRGWSLLNLGRLEEAQADFAAAAAMVPGDPGVLLNQGFLHLLQGDFAAGLPLYENRKRLPRPFDVADTALPEWTGAQEIAGKTLLVHHGQGLGDAIQFFRYAVMAAQRGARVKLAAPAELRRLLASAAQEIEFVDPADPPAGLDFHIALMSLPLALELRRENIAASGRQLAAEPMRVRHWAARLNPLRIGVAWQGKDDMGKCFPPQALAGIAALQDVQMICLQKGTAPPADVPMLSFPDLDGGPDAFLDTAAILEQCDLVITADTALAHLAGALGVPAWVALKYVPDWRWFLERDDSPWWDSLRLFRQKSPGDWDGVFAAMREELRTRLAERQYLPN